MSEIDFWLTSGWHLLNKDNENRLLPSEDFMKAYFIRPEVQIVSESCLQEIKLNKKLLNNPFCNVDKKEIELIDDNDVKFNYRMILNFRDFLLVNCVWGENSLIDSIILSKKEIR